MEKERLAYIDIAKGLLVLMVVVGHFENVYSGLGYPNNNAINGINSIENLWVSYFMPAFFVITGFCSNFNKTMRETVWINFKTIMIPAICFTVILAVVINLSSFGDMCRACVNAFKSVIKFGGTYWFLSALFLSKLVFSFLGRLTKNEYIMPTICLLLMVLGLYLYTCNNVPNIWYFKHALFMMPFIWLGTFIRNITISNRMFLLMGGANILVVALLLSFGFPVPNISHGLKVSMSQLPLALFLSTTGICGIFGLARKISHNMVLEFFGKASLVIYMTHIVVYKIAIPQFAETFMQNKVMSSCTCELFIVIINMIICTIVYRLVNTQYFKFIVGKF